MPFICPICNRIVSGEKPFLSFYREKDVYMFHEECLGPQRVVPNLRVSAMAYYIPDDGGPEPPPDYNKFH